MAMCHKPWKSLLSHALALGYASAAIIQPRYPLLKRDDAAQSTKIAVLGDSYGSGLAYLNSEMYRDTNDDGCYRWKQAYAAQLEKDHDDFSGTVDMQFKACTGSRLISMAAGVNPQINQVKGDVDLIVLTVGGNDAGFYNVASNCIFHDQSGNYEPAFPDPSSACAIAIQQASDYINSQTPQSGRSLDFDVRATYNDLLKSDVYKSKPHTYHTGYIHFFNEEKEGDWCEASSESFNVIPAFRNPQVLTIELRSKINSLVEDVNNVLKKVTADYKDSKFSYVEISERFQGHRFCEPGSNHFKQYYDDNVWLWNLSPPIPSSTQIKELAFNVNPIAPIATTGLWNTTTTTNLTFITTDLSQRSDQTGAGWTLRPMHPKRDGYTAFKDAIVEQMKKDNIPGVKL